MIIAIDFDGVLNQGAFPAAGPLDHQLVDLLPLIQEQGHTVVLWTCRAGILLADALEALSTRKFRPNLVNANCPTRITEYGTDSRKVSADLYIDDRAAGYTRAAALEALLNIAFPVKDQPHA